jgi:hypothetical protein
MITSKSIDLLLRGVRAEFANVVDQADRQLAAYSANIYLDATNKTGALFEEISAQGLQRVESIGITGVQELQPTAESQEFVATDYVPSFITRVEPYKFTRRIKVTRESTERRDSKYQKALDEASKLQIAAENTKARHRFDRLNNAFAVVTANHLFDYGDGVPLVSASHPMKEGSAVQSNIVTASDISPTSIESMVLVLQNQLDDIGEPMPMGGGHKYIIVPPTKVRRAKEVIESEWVVDTANNNVNVWKGQGWSVITSPFLSAINGGSNTAWFIVDANFSPLKDVMFRPVTNETWFDENTKVFVHDISFEHKVGAYDWRGLVGNQGV